jgi:hypothetical protein
VLSLGRFATQSKDQKEIVRVNRKVVYIYRAWEKQVGLDEAVVRRRVAEEVAVISRRGVLGGRRIAENLELGPDI